MQFIKTADLYIFKCVTKPLFSLTILILSIVWLSQSLRFLELIVNNSVGLQSYLHLILYLLPDLFSTLFPVCLLIAGVQTYQKMIAENEVAVLRSSGFSNFQIAKPFLFLCFLGTVFCLLVNIFVIPESYKKFSSYQHQIKKELSSSMIKPGSFNEIKGVTVYVKERSRIDELKGVFIHVNCTDEKNGYVIAAQEGQLKRVDDQLLLILINGTRQEWDKDKNCVSVSGFETFSYDLSNLLKGPEQRSIRPMERSIQELLNPIVYEQDIQAQQRMIVEGHQRILLPFLCLLNGLVTMAILLFGDLRRRQRKRKVFLSFLTAGILQIGFIGLLNASAKNPSLLWVSYGTLVACMIGFLTVLNKPKGFLFFKGN